ncbi:hypothetical protein HQ587_01160, partial [bacterium]|nr:hypothetical protein [bacterium]
MRYISFLLIITGIIISIPNTLYAPLRGENVYPVSRLWSVWDDGEEVIVRDDYAYVATGYSGLQIVDVSDPESL